MRCNRLVAVRRFKHSITGLMALGAATSALGQSLQLEEIVVTAQKREQKNLEVPVSLSVFSNDALRQAGVDSVQGLDAITPGITFNDSLSSAGEGVRVRGVGSAGFNAGVEQSVSVIIDNVVTGPSGSGISDLWDVQHLEVLRGPQGTLFGKNASAGVINIITNNPSAVFEAELGVRYEFEYESPKIDGFISGPLTDNLSARLSGFYLDQDEGFIENVVRNETTNKSRKSGIRAKFLYENGPWVANLSVAHAKVDDDCCTRTFRALDAASVANPVNVLTRGFLLPALARNNIELGSENRQTFNEAIVFEKSDTVHVAIEVSRELSDGHIVKSITGYRHWDQHEGNDADTIDIDLASFSEQMRDLKIMTQELQLISPPESTFEYVLGLYYFKQDFDEFTSVAGGEDFPLAPFGDTVALVSVDVENYAAFGHVTYHMTDQLKIYAGARILQEEIQGSGRRFGNPVTHFAFPGNLPGGTAESDDTDYVGTAGIQFFPTEESMVFFSVSRGYKGRAVDTAFDSVLFRGDTESTLLDPETVISFELGTKNQFFDNRLSVNATLFYSEFEDFQSAAFDGNAAAFVLRNAGNVETQGLELDLAAVPWENGLLNFAFAWVDSTYAEYKGAPCTVPATFNGTCDPTVGQDLSGKQLQASPEFKYSISFKQDFMLANDMEAYVRAQWAWRDDAVRDGDLDPNTLQEAYGTADFQVGILPTDTLELSAFVKNAFNEQYALTIFDSPLFQGAYSQFLAPERTYGVEIRSYF